MVRILETQKELCFHPCGLEKTADVCDCIRQYASIGTQSSLVRLLTTTATKTTNQGTN